MSDLIVIPQQDNALTILEFRRLFALEERVKIDDFENNASLTAQQKAVIRTMQRDMALATAIKLSDSDTIFGVQFLEQCKLIATGRAAQILAS